LFGVSGAPIASIARGFGPRGFPASYKSFAQSWKKTKKKTGLFLGKKEQKKKKKNKCFTPDNNRLFDRPEGEILPRSEVTVKPRCPHPPALPWSLMSFSFKYPTYNRGLLRPARQHRPGFFLSAFYEGWFCLKKIRVTNTVARLHSSRKTVGVGERAGLMGVGLNGLPPILGGPLASFFFKKALFFKPNFR